jgi:hypothetical protein
VDPLFTYVLFVHYCMAKALLKDEEAHSRSRAKALEGVEAAGEADWIERDTTRSLARTTKCAMLLKMADLECLLLYLIRDNLLHYGNERYMQLTARQRHHWGAFRCTFHNHNSTSRMRQSPLTKPSFLWILIASRTTRYQPCSRRKELDSVFPDHTNWHCKTLCRLCVLSGACSAVAACQAFTKKRYIAPRVQVAMNSSLVQGVSNMTLRSSGSA